jgi:Amt family ammonium transporter
VGQARVTAEHEQEGLDVSEHGVETYPEFGSDGVVADGGMINDPAVRTTGGSQDD